LPEDLQKVRDLRDVLERPGAAARLAGIDPGLPRRLRAGQPPEHRRQTATLDRGRRPRRQNHPPRLQPPLEMNVTPQDLMQMVVEADVLRRQGVGEPLPRPVTAWKRSWIEPWFNAIGWWIGAGLRILPWPVRWRADQKIIGWMGARGLDAPDLAVAQRDI